MIDLKKILLMGFACLVLTACPPQAADDENGDGDQQEENQDNQGDGN